MALEARLAHLLFQRDEATRGASASELPGLSPPVVRELREVIEEMCALNLGEIQKLLEDYRPSEHTASLR